MPCHPSRPLPAVEGLIEENLLTLAQLRNLVDDLPPDAYRQTFGAHGHHTLGKHVRHIIDHYGALLNGLKRGAQAIDYEARRRDEALEQWPQKAADRLAAIEVSLSVLATRSAPESLSLDYPLDEDRLSLLSSLARELAFLTSHTIHHMAIIALLAEQVGIGLPASFGVHPSTLRHWQRDAVEQAPPSLRRA